MTCTTPHCTPHCNAHPLCCAVQSIAPQCTVRCTVHYVHYGLEGIAWGSEAPPLQWSVATLLHCIVPYCTLHHCGSFCPLAVGEKTVGMLVKFLGPVKTGQRTSKATFSFTTLFALLSQESRDRCSPYTLLYSV